MPIFVKENKYLTQVEICELLAISRQTLWRWAKSGDIPSGSRLRKKQRIFTEEEFQEIKAFAQRIEPIVEQPTQMRLQLVKEGESN